MKRFLAYGLISFLAFLTSVNKSYGQALKVNGLKQLISAIDSNQGRLPVEKLYIHFDKPQYAIGDTLWFKSYLFDAAYLNGSTKSGLFYIELANDSNRVVKRMMLPLTSGLGCGTSLYLIKNFQRVFIR